MKQPNTHDDASLRLDRRSHPRLPVERPARLVRDGATHGALSGLAFARTADLSVGGALIEIVSTRPFNVGDAVRVAVLSESVVIDPRSMSDAKVVRIEPAGPGRQRVAVRFARDHAMPLVA
ncbi:MAG: PilZ domain-containing protein [Phycisphaerales bacterium]